LDSSLKITSKLPGVGESIFSVMTALANEHKALNMAQGFPEFGCSKELVKLVGQYMRKGHNQYAPMPGIYPLREEISKLVSECYSADYDVDTEITVVPGATMGLYTAISAMIHEEDEVIVIEPAYDSYIPAIKLQGGIPKYFQMQSDSDHPIDWSSLRKMINIKTRMIIINSPHNPTGLCLTSQDMRELEKTVEGTDIVILSDEVYEHIIFDGYEHQSVARYPNLAKRSFIVSSFGKTYHATGWKMGYCLAPKDLMKEFRKAYQFMVFSVNTPVQYAFAEFIKNREEINAVKEMYQEKRNIFRSAIEDSKFTLLPCNGSYFQMLTYENISDEGDMKFSQWLTKEHKIASIPVSAFYKDKRDDRILRFCFAKNDKTLKKAGDILCKI
jgi:methionine aminotransferase